MAGLPRPSSAAAQGGAGGDDDDGGRSPAPRRPAHRRRFAAPPAGDDAARQEVWVGFGGRADQAWLRLLAPGFRHCFAAVHHAPTNNGTGGGWTVLDPLSGRLLVAPLDVPPGFDLPAYWRRCGHAVLGPFAPAAPRPRLPSPLTPLTCVGLVRALLGPGAPFALTPRGLHRALARRLAQPSATPASVRRPRAGAAHASGSRDAGGQKNFVNSPRNLLTSSPESR